VRPWLAACGNSRLHSASAASSAPQRGCRAGPRCRGSVRT
jgi:hypothetical protein